MSSSRRVMQESMESNLSPTKARRSRSSVRTSFSSVEEESLGGGDGVRSSGALVGRSYLPTHWPSISFLYPKDATAAAPMANERLTLTKGSLARGMLKCCRIRVTRWGYGRGAFTRNALWIRWRTRWPQ